MTAEAQPEQVEARLRDIQAITDAALSRAGDSDFLDQLLDRVKGVLKADTAALLLLDYSSGELIATAAAGLKEEGARGYGSRWAEGSRGVSRLSTGR